MRNRARFNNGGDDDLYDEVISEDIRVPVLILLNRRTNPVFDEALLHPPFFKVYITVLTKTERLVTDMLIEGKEKGEIAKTLGVKVKSVQNYISAIKYKFTHEDDQRLDNKIKSDVHREQWVNSIKKRRGWK